MLSKDQIIGFLMLAGAIIGIVVYGLLVYLWPLIVLQVTAFLAIAAILAIIAWIGYTLATTPPPKPIEDIESELKKETEGQAGEEGKA